MPDYTTYIGEPNVLAFDRVVNTLRTFLRSRGFVEVHTQDRLSILAACEDPFTLTTYEYDGQQWPLPQTGQMWLERELLTRPDVPGVFCVSTSYRQEPNPVPGRHRIVFPMFEFESRGDMTILRALCRDMIEHLGISTPDRYVYKDYEEMAKYYGVKELESEHESRMVNDFGRVVFLENFPIYTSPFWNMKRNSATHSNKIDVIIDGMETFGTAERSCNIEEMRQEFKTIMNGAYAEKLYELFGQKRVDRELEEFFELPFEPRFGGGIGVTRLVRAVQNNEGVFQKITA